MNTQATSSCLAEAHPDPVETAVWAVVPVKVLSDAKQRLHDCLGDKREEFTLAMLEDVLDALAQSRLVGQVACVTADRRVAALAIGHGAMVFTDLPSRKAVVGLSVEGRAGFIRAFRFQDGSWSQL